MTRVWIRLCFHWIPAILMLAPFHLILLASEPPTSNFYNVLVQDGADPSVYRHSDGYYYSTYTTGGDVRVWRHRSLSGMAGGEAKVVWSGCCHI